MSNLEEHMAEQDAITAQWEADHPPRWDHAFTFAFTLESGRADAEDVTPAELIAACRKRLNSIEGDNGGFEMLEACLPPYDSTEVSE